MDELVHSVEANNVLNAFYDVDRIVFVEGDGDVQFWEIMFQKFSGLSVEIQDVGGKPQIKRHIEDILLDKSDCIVAMDSDYDYLGQRVIHRNVISTYGYSIENTMVNQISITKLVKYLSRIPSHKIDKSFIADWFVDLEESVKPLLIQDIINHQDFLGCAVIPLNCDRFMTSKNSCILSNKLIEAYLKDKNLGVSTERLEACCSQLEESSLGVLDLLRGHFLMSSVFRFVKYYLKKLGRVVSISHDMFYGAILATFESSFNEAHHQYEFYKAKIGAVI